MDHSDKLEQSRTQADGAGSAPKSTAVAKAGGRRLRWLSLCVALSAITASLALLLLLRHGLPLSFSGSLLFALLVGAGLPALVTTAVSGRAPDNKLGLAKLWCLCCLPIALILVINLLI